MVALPLMIQGVSYENTDRISSPCLCIFTALKSEPKIHIVGVKNIYQPDHTVAVLVDNTYVDLRGARMKRKMPNEESSQIDTIKGNFDRFYSYMIQKEGNSTVVESIKEMVDTAYASSDIKSLKNIDREMNVFMREIMPVLPFDGQELIQDILQQDSLKREEALDTIMKRGKIITKKEYALIHTWPSRGNI